jgi:hypothetical protein
MLVNIAFSTKVDGALCFALGKTKKVAPRNVVLVADQSCGSAHATSLGTSVPLMQGTVLHVELLSQPALMKVKLLMLDRLPLFSVGGGTLPLRTCNSSSTNVCIKLAAFLFASVVCCATLIFILIFFVGISLVVAHCLSLLLVHPGLRI